MKKILPITFPITIMGLLLFLLFGSLQQNARAATFIVSKTTDSNDGLCNADCSLREAVTAASNGDTIRFANNLSAMSISLSTALSITNNLIIDGSTLPQRVTIQMSGSERILETSGTLVLNSLIFQNGLTNGAIYNSGNLTINNVHFENNAVSNGNGGAINNEGVLTIDQSTFTNNQASDRGGAIYNKLAITSNSPLDTIVKITNSTFTQNNSLHGGAIFNDFDIEYSPSTGPEGQETPLGIITPSSLGYVEILDSIIANNSALRNGGGIVNYVSQKELLPAVEHPEAASGIGFPTHGIVYILGSTIISNTAVSYGGGIHNTVITPTLTPPAEAPLGNHTFAGFSAVLIEQAYIANNSANYGAGIANTTLAACLLRTPTGESPTALPADNVIIGLYDSLVENNNANINGGGLYMGDELGADCNPNVATPILPDITIGSSTFVGNRATEGGGAYNKNGRIVIGNSTFSANFGDRGAAIVNLLNADLELWHTTIYTNSIVPTPANSTFNKINGGIGNSGSLFNSGQLRIENSIIAGTNGPATEDCVSTAGLATGSNNIILSGTSCSNNSITVDPNLKPLAQIIGYTPVHDLASDSSAVDAAGIIGCSQYLVGNKDQRGLERPVSDSDEGGQCDIGAVEYTIIGNIYLPIILKQ